MSLTYEIHSDLRRVRAEDSNDGCVLWLSESDLIEMLSAIQGSDAYTPEPRTGEL